MPDTPSDHCRHVLITGGGGYLGSVLVPTLLRAGHRVSVLDSLLFGQSPLSQCLGHPLFRLHQGDVCHPKSYSELLPDVDAVVHLAGLSNDPTSDLDPDLTIRINYRATNVLAEHAAAAGVRRFVFASSCSVYGASASQSLDESAPTNPLTLYALTKLMNERDLLQMDTSSFCVTALRFSTLFGLAPRMRFDLVVNGMTRNVIRGRNIIINGAGTQYRPFVHVLDAADAVIRTLHADQEEVDSQIFNIGDDDLNYSIRELAEDIQRCVPAAGIEFVPANVDERSYHVSFGKAQRVLGFRLRRSIADGVGEIRRAVANGDITNMDDEMYYNLPVIKRYFGGLCTSHENSSFTVEMLHSLSSSRQKCGLL